jgi:hypothetical protein
MTQRIIIVGDSHSASSGFSQNTHRHYVNILHKVTGCDTVNRSIGGMSNNEIFQRSAEFVLTGQHKAHDIFIVQWSSLHRLWAYHHANNVDDFTQIVPHPCGLGDPAVAKNYNTLYTAYFCNDYVALKHWFAQMCLLETLFKANNIQYLFVNGFDNFLSDLHPYRNQTVISLQATPLNDRLRGLLDFDNRPDDYIMEKFNTLVSLYSRLDLANCVKFGHFHFGRDRLDLADDNQHWGAKTNAVWADEILDHLAQRHVVV